MFKGINKMLSVRCPDDYNICGALLSKTLRSHKFMHTCSGDGFINLDSLITSYTQHVISEYVNYAVNYAPHYAPHSRSCNEMLAKNRWINNEKNNILGSGSNFTKEQLADFAIKNANMYIGTYFSKRIIIDTVAFFSMKFEIKIEQVEDVEKYFIRATYGHEKSLNIDVPGIVVPQFVSFVCNKSDWQKTMERARGIPALTIIHINTENVKWGTKNRDGKVLIIEAMIDTTKIPHIKFCGLTSHNTTCVNDRIPFDAVVSAYNHNTQKFVFQR